MTRWSPVRVAVAVLLGLVILAGAFTVLARRIEGGREADKVRALGVALNGGAHADYVAAVAAVRRAETHPGDGDAQAASLLLDSLADPAPATRPPGTVESALRMMEEAAVADPSSNVSVIAATMRNGVAAPKGSPVLLPPNLAVAACWAKVEARTEAPATCVALRRSGRS